MPGAPATLRRLTQNDSLRLGVCRQPRPHDKTCLFNFTSKTLLLKSHFYETNDASK